MVKTGMNLQFAKIGLYKRLSHEDGLGESVSIEHQEIILRKFVADNGGTVTEEYVDDGWSGTNFERPGVKKLLEDAQTGRIDTIIVKDLSRFGRNYIQVGQYIDYIFPAYGIRFIAVNDNIDTADRQSAAMDMMPIMNVFNEWHAANTSKKIRAVLKASWCSGKYTNWNYCYGYRAGTDPMRTAVIDEEAAKVVRRIFDLRARGCSYRKIAKILSDEAIANPTNYFRRLDGQRSNRPCAPFWHASTVSWILSNPTYLGTTVQHKTTTISYKNHKVVSVPANRQITKINAHAAIIDKALWEKVQQAGNASAKGRADKSDVVHPLSGLVVCADCGKKLKMKRTRSGSCRYYCSTYINLGKKYCASHSVSEETLLKLISEDLRNMLCAAKFDEARAREKFVAMLAQSDKAGRFSDERKLKALQNRSAEVDKLAQAAFEEKVLKHLPEELYLSLSEKYLQEKQTLEAQIAQIEQHLARPSQYEVSADEYLKKLKNCLNFTPLTREMCLQLVRCVVVGQAGKIHIYYAFGD